MQEVHPQETARASAFALWKKAPMPMITLFKTLTVTNLERISKKSPYKFNMLLCWCIGKAASQTADFYLLPVEDKLIQYDKLAISMVVETREGGINTCDLPYSDRLPQFRRDYLKWTKQVQDTGKPHNLDENYMVIGTSSLAKYEIDGAVNIYAGLYNNPFLIWGKYRKSLFKTTLPISFQFHHTQMDGIPAAKFLDCLQREISHLRIHPISG